MRESTPKTVYLKDYAQPEYIVGQIDLTFTLSEEETCVTSRLTLQKNRASPNDNAPLVLDGEEMTLESVKINGQTLTESMYEVSPESLTIPGAPKVEVFTLEIQTRVNLSLIHI